jgi:hypothetical protein
VTRLRSIATATLDTADALVVLSFFVLVAALIATAGGIGAYLAIGPAVALVDRAHARLTVRRNVRRTLALV